MWGEKESEAEWEVLGRPGFKVMSGYKWRWLGSCMSRSERYQCLQMRKPTEEMDEWGDG